LAKRAIETFIGFCVKARKISLGAGAIDTLKGGVYLILLCSTASDNTFKLALKYKNRFSCPMIICKCRLEDAVNKPNCKIAAVKDEGLAQAIIQSVNEDYQLYSGGSN
jgi:hypothetical protein